MKDVDVKPLETKEKIRLFRELDVTVEQMEKIRKKITDMHKVLGKENMKEYGMWRDI